MSWKKSYNSLQQLLDDVNINNGQSHDVGMQMVEARRTALNFIHTAVVGYVGPDDIPDVDKVDVTITLEGHANVEHKAGPDGQKDYVQITVRQK